MKKSVLIIDDEASVRHSLGTGLVQESYNVESCTNAVSALKLLHNYEQRDMFFDAVVMNSVLPDIDGDKLAKIIKDRYPDLKIIYLSNNADDYNSEEIPATKVFPKPIVADEVIKHIKEIAHLNNESFRNLVKGTKQQTSILPIHSVYAFVKLEDGAEFFDVYKQIYFGNNVLYCDATNGDYDIILLVQADNEESCKSILDKIKEINGIAKISEYPVVEVQINEETKSIINNFSIHTADINRQELQNVVCSYVFLHVAKDQLDEIYPVLFFNDNIVYSDYVGDAFVLLVQGKQFNEIDTFVQGKLSKHSAVLKAKEYPIVTIYEM